MDAGQLEHAVRHGLGPVVRARLGLPPDPVERAQFTHVKDTLDQLIEAIVPLQPTVLKGVPLSERYYSAFGYRPTSDIDLLVRADEIVEYEARLLDQGYAPSEKSPGRIQRRWDKHLIYEKPGSPLVELHYVLHGGFGAPLVADAFIDRSVVHADRDGPPMRVLDREDELIFLSVHAASHRFRRLGWLFDLRQILEAANISASIVVERAETHRVVRSVSIALALAERDAGARLPPELRTLASSSPTLAPWLSHGSEQSAWLDRATSLAAAAALADDWKSAALAVNRKFNQAFYRALGL